VETFEFCAQTRIQYPNIVARGAVGGLGRIVSETLPELKRIVVVSDDRVASLHWERVAAGLREAARDAVTLVTFPHGEAGKSLAAAERLIERLLDEQVHRRSLVVALGGGVVCDTVGFAASVYMRGIDYLNVPTSLMAQVDAAIGGKVAVNHETCKNLVGQFWHPRAVVVDPELLRTLPWDEVRNGLAEVVKVAMIHSADFFAELEAAAPRLVDEIGRERGHDGVIAKAIKAKLDLLAPDPFERGDLRRTLNFGHTFAHPLEVSERFQLRHGFAVSVGMAIATAVAVNRGLLPKRQGDRVFALLRALGLRTCGPPLDPRLVWTNSRLIRCIRANCLHYVVPVAIGRVDFIEDLNP
jgi:3-dehydroquinate synthase